MVNWADHLVNPGVIEVNIPISLNNTKGTVRNAVNAAVMAKLNLNSLPGPFQNVMYVLNKCYQECGWAAYAYVNSWNSVYQGDYYKMVGVQVHELGHNFNLAHSGGLNNATYTDHTCLVRIKYVLFLALLHYISFLHISFCVVLFKFSGIDGKSSLLRQCWEDGKNHRQLFAKL